MSITPGKEISLEEANAPLQHMVGRFKSEVATREAEKVRDLARDIGVNWYEQPGPVTTWFTFRGPGEVMMMFHETMQKAEWNTARKWEQL